MALEQIAQAAGGPVGMAAATGMQALVGVAQLIAAGRQNKEAKELSAKTVRPEYNIQQPILDNQALAEREASQGLSDAAMLVYENNMNRSLSNSIDAILRGGGNVNNIGDLYDTAEDNFAQIALLEEEVRRKNIQNYVSQNERLAQELDKEFQINQWAPYKDTIQQIAELRKQAAANKSAAFNTIGSAFANFATGSKLAGANVPGAAGAAGTAKAATTGAMASAATSFMNVVTQKKSQPQQQQQPTPQDMVGEINQYMDMYYKNYNNSPWE